MEMNTHIILLRGINVGGHKKIKMVDFKELLLDHGFQNIRTYIQSGNIFCESHQEKSVVQQHIQSLIMENYGFEVTAFVLSKSELEHIVQNNPFIQADVPIEKVYCTLLERQADRERKEQLLQFKTEEEDFVFANSLLYFCYHNGYGKAKVTNSFVERKLKMQSTARNWKTMLKLLDMSA